MVKKLLPAFLLVLVGCSSTIDSPSPDDYSGSDLKDFRKGQDLAGCWQGGCPTDELEAKEYCLDTELLYYQYGPLTDYNQQAFFDGCMYAALEGE